MAEPVAEVNFGMSLTEEMVSAMLSAPLRSLRLERLELTEDHPFWRLLDVPDLEELVLGRMAMRTRRHPCLRRSERPRDSQRSPGVLSRSIAASCGSQLGTAGCLDRRHEGGAAELQEPSEAA